MEGVPVKISEQCRPPNKVHLPATLRTLPPTEPIVQPVTFELETNALHWVQERRRNLLAERTERKSRLELKDEAKRKRKEEMAEQAKKLEEERQKREEEERQRLEVEAAKRLVEEEEQLKREEEQRLEEFRRKRHQLQQETPAVADSRASQTADSSQPSTADPAASPPADEAAPAPSPAPAATQTPDTAAVAVPVSSSASASASTSTTAPAASSVTLPPPATTSSAALPPPAAVSSAGVPPPAASTAAAHSAAASAAAAAPPGATQSTQVWPAAGAVSSNPFNPFSRPASAVMQPQCWQQQQQGTGAAEPRSGSFNYRDFESQASDPFDSVELKTINDMEELASVFRPPPASAASAAPAPAATQPQLAYSYHHQQQQQHQQPSQHSHHQQHRSQQSQQSQHSQQPQQQQQQYYPHAAGSAAGPNQGGGGTGYGFPHSYVAYPAQSYAQPAYSSIPSKTFPAEQSTYRYPTTGYAYTSAGGREPFPAARPSSFPAASAAGSSGPAASAAYPAVSSAAATATAGAAAAGAAAAPAQPDARQLQEFYTRYYATPGRASPGLPGLRSSRSVPDLCEEVQREAEGGGGGGGGVAADGGAAKRTKSHTPPPQPTANGPTSAAQVCVPQSEPVADISDPLHGLDPAVKARLQELSQMGFPVDRLRRLHNQFNGDEKQVIEFCLSAQRLEEAGHSPLAAERGLIECDGDLGRAADFLSSLAQLTGLGFPEPRAADALRRSDMHRDRALDLLIQG